MIIKLIFESAGGGRGGASAGRVAGLRLPRPAPSFAPDEGAARTPPREAEVDGVPEIGERFARPADWRHAGRVARGVEDVFVVVTLALLLALGATAIGYALDPAPIAPPARVA